jgi:hypothetical protein
MGISRSDQFNFYLYNYRSHIKKYYSFVPTCVKLATSVLSHQSVPSIGLPSSLAAPSALRRFYG